MNPLQAIGRCTTEKQYFILYYNAYFKGITSNKMNYYAAMNVTHIGGTLTTDAEGISIEGASETIIYFNCGTDFNPSYKNYLSLATEKGMTYIITPEKKRNNQSQHILKK